MTSNARLRLSFLIIVASAAYAVLIVKDPAVASAISSWYIAVLLTIFVTINVWKRP